MKANQVSARGSMRFSVSYGVELLEVVDPMGYLNSAKIMMVQSMAIIHY